MTPFIIGFLSGGTLGVIIVGYMMAAHEAEKIDRWEEEK